MPRIDIRTTLGFCPRPKKHEIIYITRGATASFCFALFDKMYSFKNIDQMTFSFKQGKQIQWYNLIEYFKPSEDTKVRDYVKYYKMIKHSSETEDGECVVELVINPTGNPKNLNYYEVFADPGDITEDLDWRHNEHFSYPENYDFINFMLFPENTKVFEPTVPDDNVKFEITIKLNTDLDFGAQPRNSVIIEPQHPVAVIDSIYSRVENDEVENSGYTANQAIPSVITLCSTSLLCDKYAQHKIIGEL